MLYCSGKRIVWKQIGHGTSRTLSSHGNTRCNFVIAVAGHVTASNSAAMLERGHPISKVASWPLSAV